MSSSKNQTWDDYLNEVEAELSDSASERTAPEPTPEQKRLQERQEARDLANSVRLGSATGSTRTGDLAPVLGDNATAEDIASRVRINGRTGGQPPQIKRAARFIDPLNR